MDSKYGKSTLSESTDERDEAHIESTNLTDAKTAADGTILVPQPNDDPQDPLNWPAWRKYATFGTLCLAAFTGLGSAIAHANGLLVQAKVYQTTPTAMSYSISSAVAGLAAGPYIFVPLARVIGTSAVIFWSLIGMICCGIWSASMTGEDQYIAFVLSRMFGGLFSSIPQILGNGMIVDMFFLHERGRAFAVYSTSYTLGVTAGPTFDGFIVEHTSWSVEFWWTVGLQIFVLILAFVVLEETRYSRDGKPHEEAMKSHSYIIRRFKLFFTGAGVLTSPTLGEFLKLYVVPVKIFFSPVTLLIGVFSMINFAWPVLVSTLLGIFLQEPRREGGYAFSPQRAAGFYFALWVGIFASQAYNFLLNDRVPLRIAAHRGGTWRPEYRLYTLWPLTLILMPIGLGVFGAALHYGLHYMVLALAAFLIYLSGNAAIAAPVNYLVETFRQYPQEVGTVLNVWRLLLGLVIPFFIDQWEEEVGINWVFGTCAFMNIFGSALVFIVMWKGALIRKASLEAMSKSEEGARVTKAPSQPAQRATGSELGSTETRSRAG